MRHLPSRYPPTCNPDASYTRFANGDTTIGVIIAEAMDAVAGLMLTTGVTVAATPNR